MAQYLNQSGLQSVLVMLKSYIDNSVPTKVSDLEDSSNYALASDIPSDEHINSLINNALEVIEDGYY